MSGSRQALTRLWSNAERAFISRSGTKEDNRELAGSAPVQAGESEKELERLRQKVRQLEAIYEAQNEIIDDLRNELRARSTDELSQMFLTYTAPPK